MLADVVIGLLVAGVIVGALVPALGSAVGPAAALGVAAASVVGRAGRGAALRRSREPAAADGAPVRPCARLDLIQRA